MNGWIGKTPFIRLLIPLIIGIMAGTIFPGVTKFSFPGLMAGLSLMLMSYFISPSLQYRFRWLFGAGLTFFLCSLATWQIEQNLNSVNFHFLDSASCFTGIVQDIPETKPKTIAINIKTNFPERKKFILYLEKTDGARKLHPGDEIIFSAKLQPFRDFNNLNNFDYAHYMKMKGFSGMGYVSAAQWEKTGKQSNEILILAQQTRAKALKFYHSFGLGEDAQGFISALTLGYKENLSDDLREAFRASGTAHILALSGLHVAIIYAVIDLLFSFLGKNGSGYTIRQWLIILFLWSFAFITGLSASVIRATFMLTLLCLGHIFKRNGITYNSLASAAFLILVFRPFYLFDVSFQLSFASVFSILYFNPALNLLFAPSNNLLKYVWNVCSVTLSAQLGAFPLVLYHFGTFPTYFLFSNLLVVPLVSIIIYITVTLILFGLALPLGWTVISQIYPYLQQIEKFLIELLLRIVYFFESIPFAQITDKKLSMPQLLLLMSFIYLSGRFFTSRKAKSLMLALSLFLLFELTITGKELQAGEQKLTLVTSGTNQSEIVIQQQNRLSHAEIPFNRPILIGRQSILLLNDARFNQFRSTNPFPLDILVLSNYEGIEIVDLLNLFHPKMIVLDHSIPRTTATQITHECLKRKVDVHDVTRDGVFSINF